VKLLRQPQDHGQVAFDLPALYGPEKDRVIEEMGLIARRASDPDNPNPATLYNVMFTRSDGTQGSRLGGFSVPADIADAVEALLLKEGYTVDS
jgi:hypothetical protein